MRFLTLALMALLSLGSLTMSTEANAYWHGYRGGWHGYGWHGAYGWHGGPGCWRCGGGWGPGPAVAAGFVGAAAAASVVAAESAPVVVAPPAVYVQPGATVVEPVGAAAISSIPPVGSKFPTLLPGCVLAPRNGINFYQCEGFRMRPLYGGNNLFYRVVPG